MRMTFWEPEELTTEVVENMLVMVGVTVQPEAIDTWERPELLRAYDWAAREYLDASDNIVRRRPRPHWL